MTNVSKAIEKSSLEKFYQGWPHFKSMNKGSNFIVFKVSGPAHVKSSIQAAQARISTMALPLEVLGTGDRSSTFIVKEVANA